jgi:hypothetical protein
MTMQSHDKGYGPFNNPWAQIGLLGAAVILLIVLAAHYVW